MSLATPSPQPASGRPAEPRAVVIFDGECALCDAAVRFILARDIAGHFRFVPRASDEAKALVGAAALEQEAAGSIVLVAAGGIHTQSDAVLRILGSLGPPWCWLRLLRCVPRPLRDAVYRVVARNRYRWFGTAACPWDAGRPGMDDRRP